MKTLIKSLLAFLSVNCALACSQFDSEIGIRNLGFEVKSEIAWNAEHMAYTLRLSLSDGEDGDYVFAYIIDEDPLTKLTSTGGGSIESGSEIELTGKNVLIFLLPPMPSDSEHTLTMEFSKDGVSRSYKLPLPDTSQNGIGIRIDTDETLDFSRVILTNLMGASVTTYNVTFYLDGDILTSIKYMSNTFNGVMDIDFAQSESYTFELPYLVAGEHVLKVDVKSTLGSESTRLSFTEPQRRQTALTFSYNPFTGKLMLESEYNPLKTTFDITMDFTVGGYITYRPKKFFGISDPQTDTFISKGEATARLTPGITATQIDGGKLKSLMDEVYSNTRVDAANAIGNSNKRTLHANLLLIELQFTIHSLGEYSGNTVVTIQPSKNSLFPIRYTYEDVTWEYAKGTTETLYPLFYVNGTSPGKVRIL